MGSPRFLVKYFVWWGVFLLGCAEVVDNQPAISVYHWRTKLHFSAAETDFLVKVSAGRVYAKFFDLDWTSEGAAPTAIVRADTSFRTDSLELVPVVFITNRTFKNSDPATLPDLARRTADLIQKRLKHLGVRAPEWQFDCDWTPTTRARFFRFLEVMRTHLPPGTVLSSTLRLHQFRYPDQTGVPPVDRGALMVYNVGNIDDPDERNSILTYATAAAYLQSANPYPLPLDVALPIFRWGVVFRHGAPVRLIDGLDRTELLDTTRYRALPNGRFQLRRSQYLRGQYLYRDDVVRPEAIDRETFERVRALALRAVGPRCERIILYKLEDAPQLTFFPGF